MCRKGITCSFAHEGGADTGLTNTLEGYEGRGGGGRGGGLRAEAMFGSDEPQVPDYGTDEDKDEDEVAQGRGGGMRAEGMQGVSYPVAPDYGTDDEGKETRQSRSAAAAAGGGAIFARAYKGALVVKAARVPPRSVSRGRGRGEETGEGVEEDEEDDDDNAPVRIRREPRSRPTREVLWSATSAAASQASIL